MHPEKIIKYGSRLACVSDYANFHKMERTDFSKAAVAQAVFSIPPEEQRDEKTENFWSQVSNLAPGVKHIDLVNIDLDQWDAIKAQKYYKSMRNSINATLALDRNYQMYDYDLNETATKLKMNHVDLINFLKGSMRLPEGLILAIKKSGEEFTMDELADAYDKVLLETGWLK